MLTKITPDAVTKCTHQLEAIARKHSYRMHASCVSICARGLASFLQGIETNEKYIVITLPIYEFFQARLPELFRRVQAAQDDGFDEIYELCFALLEELAVFAREKYLRTGGHVTPEEAAVMRYFEQSGLWDIDDGTLVGEYYFTRLPSAAPKLCPDKFGELRS